MMLMPKALIWEKAGVANKRRQIEICEPREALNIEVEQRDIESGNHGKELTGISFVGFD